MSTYLTHLLRACALACAALATIATHAQTPASGPANAAAAPVPLASFFDNPVFTGARLSPNASALAVRFGGGGARDRLAVINLANNTIKVVASFSDGDVGDFDWVNDERLVFNSADKRLGVGQQIFASGLYAVNRDGSDYRQLASLSGDMVREHSVGTVMLPWNTFMMGQHGRQNSEFIYVTSPKYRENGDLDYVNLLRLNTLNGRATTVERPAAGIDYWMLDHQGEPRLSISHDKNVETVWYRDPASAKWRVLTTFDSYQGGKGAFGPLAFGPDGALYVDSNIGADKHALHVFDFATNAVKREPLMALQDFDFDGSLVTDQAKLLGVRYLSDATGTAWFDARMTAVQADIDAQLPATVNLVTVAQRAAAPLVLVDSFSDTQPHRYSLYNTQTKTFNPVGEAHPAIDARHMATQELVHYKARDGLTIPAWLTIPHGSKRKNLPLVVLVHGGPNVRGTEWGWRADTQFLASRGYAVLEPEFRGSTGFGVAHFKAGWKQWGLAMQNDVADGTRWAIAEGIVDPKRICIAGASYGGYATLMGLVNDPDLYKCGIDWAGVTDIKLLYTGAWSAWSDINDVYKQYGMPLLVGDLVKDAAQLKATSPIEQAARIKAPLLLAYGGSDTRVPIYHGRRFYEAVKATNPDVEWVVYSEEGHGWALPQNRIDFWGRVERFLDRNIGH